MTPSSLTEMEELARNLVLSQCFDEVCTFIDERSCGCFKNALAALATARAREGWQPIASAPKDGTWIVGLAKRSYGAPYAKLVVWGESRYSGETWCTRGGCFAMPSQVIAWSPIPEIPPLPSPPSTPERG